MTISREERVLERITAMRKRRPRLTDDVVTLAHGAGVKFTSRWTWLLSPLNSRSSHSKSVQTSRMTCPSRPGAPAVEHPMSALRNEDQI
jgi:hypothetical protein